MKKAKCKSCNTSQLKRYSYPEGYIFVCCRCKLQWAAISKRYTIASISRADSFYMRADSIADPADYNPFRDFFQHIDILFARPNSPNNSAINILDIGCGNGRFISECLRKEFNATGVEADETLADIMPEEVANKIIFRPIENIENFPEKFHIVTFWDSFEHLDNAFETLNKMSSHLKDDGIVYLRVNNTRDIYNWITKALLYLTPNLGKALLKKCFGLPWHRWNFSYAGMCNLLRKNNWKIVYFIPGETPASRFTSNLFIIFLIKCAYAVNRLVRGGKIGNYFIKKL